jgi:hypothetical protein
MFRRRQFLAKIAVGSGLVTLGAASPAWGAGLLSRLFRRRPCCPESRQTRGRRNLDINLSHEQPDDYKFTAVVSLPAEPGWCVEDDQLELVNNTSPNSYWMVPVNQGANCGVTEVVYECFVPEEECTSGDEFHAQGTLVRRLENHESNSDII